MPLFHPSSLTFGEAKVRIASQVGKQSTSEMLTRAGASLQAAIQYYNRRNWTILRDDFTVTAAAGATGFAMPHDLRDVFTTRLIAGGNSRILNWASRRDYERLVWNQGSVGGTYAYDLFYQGRDNVAGLLEPLAADSTLSLKYFRRMAEPCAVTVTGVGLNYNATSITGISSTVGMKVGNIVTFTSAPGPAAGSFSGTVRLARVTSNTAIELYSPSGGTAAADTGTLYVGSDSHLLDIPADFEWAILAKATHHFAMGAGGIRGETLNEWAREAAVSYDSLLADDGDNDDRQMAFLPPDDGPAWDYNHVFDDPY